MARLPLRPVCRAPENRKTPEENGNDLPALGFFPQAPLAKRPFDLVLGPHVRNQDHFAFVFPVHQLQNSNRSVATLQDGFSARPRSGLTASILTSIASANGSARTCYSQEPAQHTRRSIAPTLQENRKRHRRRNRNRRQNLGRAAWPRPSPNPSLPNRVSLIRGAGPLLAFFGSCP